MDRARVMAEVQEIFRQNFDDDTIVLTDATSAADIEDWDSLEQINLLTTIEKKYGLKFNLADVRGLANIGDMLDLLARLGVE
ncbi:acyl carrier protein [Ruminococcaceae bacterium OttesenSCG-928-O06]|nr:acyl carrier protein [Ruminococcaceae bacterium OttesenSCG-928-O06]